ncbi:MAG: hypothetical protein Ct9H300mP9_7180 [Candidatus Neomarinimicrobiota bacterium]|nr:MAG: hypothetical protein Ct9H300mP9_7180 [Candidatus Neomarinimicrobiota bacterium]
MNHFQVDVTREELKSWINLPTIDRKNMKKGLIRPLGFKDQLHFQ